MAFGTARCTRHTDAVTGWRELLWSRERQRDLLERRLALRAVASAGEVIDSRRTRSFLLSTVGRAEPPRPRPDAERLAVRPAVQLALRHGPALQGDLHHAALLARPDPTLTLLPHAALSLLDETPGGAEEHERPLRGEVLFDAAVAARPLLWEWVRCFMSSRLSAEREYVVLGSLPHLDVLAHRCSCRLFAVGVVMRRNSLVSRCRLSWLRCRPLSRLRRTRIASFAMPCTCCCSRFHPWRRCFCLRESLRTLEKRP